MLTIRRVIAISAPLLIVGAVLAQTRPSSGVDAARRALNEGRYSEVEQLLSAQTDPQSIGLRGRALVEQGKYPEAEKLDRKSTRLNSSHSQISYAVFCLKKKNKKQ